MGFISWLTQPIRDTYALAPAYSDLRNPRPIELKGAAEVEAGTFETLEEQRLAALRHRDRCLVVGVPAALIVAALTFFICQWLGYNRGDCIVRAVFALILGGLFLRVAADAGVWIFRKTAKEQVLSVLAAQQGLTYQMERVDKDTMQLFKDQDLFGSDSNSGDSEDVFSGQIDGVDFLLFEARRESISRSKESSSKSLIFHGLCLRLSFPKRFSGTTRVLSDYGLLNKLHTKGTDIALERVRLEDAKFEKEFEVVSTDQVEARYLLTPALMERLMAAQGVLGKQTKLRAGFHDHHMLLTLDTRKNRSWWARLRGNLNKLHHFEIKDHKKPVDQLEMTQQFEAELAICKDIVKTLKLNMQTRV